MTPQPGEALPLSEEEEREVREQHERSMSALVQPSSARYDVGRLLATLDAARLAAPVAGEGLDVRLVALVRIGFLVTVGGKRATLDTVRGEKYRPLLTTILEAESTAAAVAALAANQPVAEERTCPHRFQNGP